FLAPALSNMRNKLHAPFIGAMIFTAGVSLPAALSAVTTDLHGDTTKTFFTRRDLTYAGVGIAGTAVVTIFDERIAQWARQPSIVGSPTRQRVVKDLTDWSGETTITWASVLGYGIGRLGHSGTVADVSLH